MFIQQVDGGSPVPLGDHTAAWEGPGQLSPDGTKLLFLRPDGLFTMPALGGQARLVVAGGVANEPLYWGGWSPDGRRIVYTMGDTVFTRGVDGGKAVALATGKLVHSPAWSPDGEWIAYVEGNVDFHVNGNIAPSGIRLVPSSGGPIVNVTEAGSLNTCPVWVPGKRALLFISDRQGGRDIYEVFLRHNGEPAGPPVRITTGLSPDRLSISADGRRLAWSVYTETTNIWSAPIPAGDSIPLSQAQAVTSGTQNIEQVAVSRDGSWLYYDSDRAGTMDLWRQPLAGGPPQQLTTDSTDEFSPSPSPDGRELAFHSYREGHRSIFVMPAAGGAATQVSTSPGDNRVARWSADGQSLLWTDVFSADSSIWVVRRKLDRSWDKPFRVYVPRPKNKLPSWTPDGRIAYVSDSGIRVIEPRTGARPVVIPGFAAGWYVWADDGKVVYAEETDSTGRVLVTASALGGKRRVLLYADRLTEQQHRYGLAVHGGRIYIPIVDRKADVWVADLEGGGVSPEQPRQQ
jgi:Tol biopolymer transport system component